jgi:serine/threonine-protein kinase
VHVVGVDATGRFYYVMRLVPGQRTLRDLIDKLRAFDATTHATFTFERRVQIVKQVAQILHYAHTKGVVHRDVKPENIMLGPFGEVYLVDWGLAKITGVPDNASGVAGVKSASGSAGAFVTGAGSFIGTPLYMAPEQATGGTVDARSDIFALAAVLYELVSLHHHLGDDAAKDGIEAILARIAGGRRIPAESHFSPENGRVPRFLSLIAERGLARDPARRYATALELDEALQHWLEGDVPCLCPATVLLALLAKWRRAIDRHPFVMGIFTFVLPIAAIVASATMLALRALPR